MATADNMDEKSQETASSAQQNSRLIELNAVPKGLGIRQEPIITSFINELASDSRPIDWDESDSHCKQKKIAQTGNRRDFKAEVKHLMFINNNTPVIVSENIEVFTLVMATFQNYENAGKGDGRHGDLQKKFVKVLNTSDVLDKDFPLYIILAHRMKLNKIYKCDNLSSFFHTLIEKMECMDPQRLCSTLTAFVDRSNFQVMFGECNGATSVINLLAMASIHLANMSSQRESIMQARGKSLNQPLYRRMIWVSIALKCLTVPDVVTTWVGDIWNKHVVQMGRKLIFNSDTIEDLKRGLRITKLLKIPSIAMINGEQMIHLAGVDGSVRPLSHLMNYLDCMAGFITSKVEMTHLIISLRAQYKIWMQIHLEKPCDLSIERTVSGAIQEGIIFVEGLSEILKQKMKSDELLSTSEEVGWLTALLQLVDLTKPGADEHLIKFLKGKSPILKKHHAYITKNVVENAKQSFSQLPIQQFSPLFKKFPIWSKEVVEQYLNTCQVSPWMTICDGSWSLFISDVTAKYPGAHQHRFLLGFFKRVGEYYVLHGRANDFVLDLLRINVPKLFSFSDNSDAIYSEACKKVQLEFSTFIQRYIYLNALKLNLQSRMSEILSSISEKSNEFQQIILSILPKEIVPELKAFQNDQGPARGVLAIATTRLEDLSWIQTLNNHQIFCWGIVATCCSKTSASISTDTFDWIYSNDYVILQLGKIYASYYKCLQPGEREKIMDSILPTGIVHLPSDDIHIFFEWVRKLQMVLLNWQKKVTEGDVNYDDILQYANSQAKLLHFENLVCPGHAEIDSQDIKSRFLDHFEKVNAHLIKYMPGNVEANYCILPQVLHGYGVLLPSNFTKHLIFPGQKLPLSGEQRLVHSINPCRTGLFQPPVKVSLEATKALTLNMLCEMAKQLDQYIKPLLEHMEMLVFFNLHHSQIFNNCVLHQLREVVSAKKAASSAHPSMISCLVIPSPQKMSKGKEDGVSIQNLANALNATRSYLVKLILGTATYSEIIAEGGELKLETINIEAESNTLTTFFATLEIASHVKSHEGLKGILCMLELFKYTSVHIPTIHNVCKQYRLDGCLMDPNLSRLVKLAADVEGSRENLRPVEAMEKITVVRASLCLNKPGSHVNSLDLFDAIANSAAFFQFVRDERFDEVNGQAVFDQQYQLITAQLQHEEYNENVLNHLVAAYKFILPFMDSKQNFEKLMSKVTSLDVSGGLKQLETVNSNITLIRLWFSRAEGDTLQNMANDLDCIIQTGNYLIEFTSSEGIVMSLHYCPAYHSQLDQPPSQEDVSSQISQPVQSYQKESSAGKERWSKEQIGDFVRKLGFLDAEKEGGDKIRRFLHLNEVTTKMLQLYNQLSYLGCLDFNKDARKNTIPCNIENPDILVQELEGQLSQWKQELSKLCAHNNWMLFFREPKRLLLIKELNDWMSLSCLQDIKDVQGLKEKMHIMSQSMKNEAILSALECEIRALSVLKVSSGNSFLPNVMWVCKGLSEQVVINIVREISFLCINNPVVFDDMKNNVKAILNKQQHDITIPSPMHAVSMFLSALLQNHTLPMRNSAVVDHEESQSIPRMSFAPVPSHVLHSCPDFTQKELVALILNIFGGVPEAFQIFHCQASATLEELDLFLQRTMKFPIKHLILEVSELPFHLQEHLMQFYLEMEHRHSGQTYCLHYIEKKPSHLRDMPWITLIEHKVELVNWNVFQDMLTQPFVQLVYGNAGDGKTHYIKGQLSRSPLCCIIAVNEAFTPLSAIRKLRHLPSEQPDCAIFFNFTLLLSGGESSSKIVKEPDDDDKPSAGNEFCNMFIEIIGWFFFNLLILGYVEDKDTGLSFRLPGGRGWRVYIEVPSRNINMTPDDALEHFRSEIPTFNLLGSTYLVPNETPFIINSEVQLVCKYLKAFKTKRIDRLYKKNIVKFSTDPNVAEDECHSLLNEYMAKHISARKITQRLFIKYMSNRCHFLDHFPAFNYNSGVGEYKRNSKGEQVLTNTRELGSSLMETMLKEVSDFCDPAIKENWSLVPHQQLIYDVKDGGASLDLITLHADRMSQTEKAKFSKMGVNVPSMMEMHSRELLDKYLSRALNIELNNGRLKPIDDAGYVLTLDYTLKMLNIHERYRSGMPVIIEGETGVGKTALVQMLSVLWNHSLFSNWNKEKGQMLDIIRQRIGALSADSYDGYGRCVQLISQLTEEKPVTYEDLLLLCNLPGSTQFPQIMYADLKGHLLAMRHFPVVTLLATKEKTDLNVLFQAVEANNTAETTAKLLEGIYFSQLKPTFYKVNIHAALTPLEIQKLLIPAFDQARGLQFQANSKVIRENIPFITVFLDEVNTSSCLGLLKEVIVDRTLDGEPIPQNVFIVAACNPHRGNSLASHKQDKWLRGSYNVRPLHPTLQLIMWDYGALDSVQERDYINAKIKVLHRSMPSVQVAMLTTLIEVSQEVMRDYAEQQLRSNNCSLQEAKVASRSCVSQRDIQRVFSLHEWFMNRYDESKPYGDNTDCHVRALLVALGIVYFMRLNTKYRKLYSDKMDLESQPFHKVMFSKAFKDELDFFINQVDLPQGIAKTQALKENIFATIICAVTRTPLIIVGAPGSSKTLSFTVTIANLKGQESKMLLFRQTDKYPSLDPHYYQCSRRTTSNEILTVFSRAINRQRSHRKGFLPINCVVFMDEAGLPEESHESLKVLHYFLDNPEVSFVAITNHVLDAAKTNRAISLFRPESLGDDLETLAKGCLCSTPDDPPPELINDLNTITLFCKPYLDLMKSGKFKQFFGLRDFIHFVNYLRRRRRDALNPQVVLEALERNFNGSAEFKVICQQFLAVLDFKLESLAQRPILDILSDSLSDRPNDANRTENEVRYKLIIDPSEDDSLVRLLFTFGVLDRHNSRVFVCSDFPGDTHLQKINTIAAIRHSAIEGHTVIMTQANDIHESFYDLFNQRFRRIDDVRGPRYYANIAIGAHSKPCRVHPQFQCVVVIKQPEVKNTPAPFLNRFEKYCLTHHALLEAALGMLPPCMAVVINAVREKTNEFINSVGGKESFYGMKDETMDSLLLSILPTQRHAYQAREPEDHLNVDHSIELVCLQQLVHAFRTSAGFCIPTFSLEELELDSQHVFHYVCADPEFKGLLKTLTPQRVRQAIAEAMQKLLVVPPTQSNNSNVGLSTEGCAMVTMAIQWLIRHMCKRLMQLMTPEAITIHRMHIHTSYLISYLRRHSHFSLKVLINDHLNTLKHAMKSFNPTKLICYTRTSSLMHKLPPSYLGVNVSTVGIEVDKAIKDIVLDDTSAVVVYKLSSKPQNSIRELLKTFTASQSFQVFLLIANMGEVTVPIINHLRIMMEEAENLSQSQSSIPPKLFVLLLHFPPQNFLNPCYPTLFLPGWDHYYLDTIGQHHGNCVIDVENWFSHCCFGHNKHSYIKEEEDSLVQTASGLLEEIIPILSSKVPFGSHSGLFPFNGQLTISKRDGLLYELLIKKGVGIVFCKQFRSYWKPSVMCKYLEQAASRALEQQSTLNITDTLHAAFKVMFMDFMVVMVSRVNENCNLDSLFVNGGSPAVDALFGDLLAVYPCPLLEQLKVLSNNLQAPGNPGYVPIFPFFHMVMNHMDQLVEQCRKDSNVSVDIVGSIANAPSSQPHDMEAEIRNLHGRMLCSLEEKGKSAPKDCVIVCMEAISNHPELWSRYFSNFIMSRLCLVSPESSIEKRIIQEVFYNLDMFKSKDKIVYLHAYMAVYQLDLAKVANILRSLALLQNVHPDSSEKLSLPSLSSPGNSAYNQSGSVFNVQHLSTFVISALFKDLFYCMHTDLSKADALKQLKLWQRAYLGIMTIPSLADNISASLAMCNNGAADMELVKAQSNLMKAVFAVLQCKTDCDSDTIDLGQKVFNTLFTSHFKENGELKGMCPHLADICQVAAQLCFKATRRADGQIHIHRLVERIFSHFFPVSSIQCCPEDCHWFLSYANGQEKLLSHAALTDTDDKNQGLSQIDSANLQVSKHIFKLYLSRMLGKPEYGGSPLNPLALFESKRRALVGEVLMSQSHLGPPSHYIPIFYKQKLEKDVINTRMHQPLAHLYFLTVMEHLSASRHTLPVLVNTYNSITESCTSAITCDQEKVLHFIEQQATVQAIMRQVALDLDQSEPNKCRQLWDIRRELNSILDDSATGGRDFKGHALVLALLVMKRVMSYRKFAYLLTEQFDTTCRVIPCLEQFWVELKEQAEPKPHLFPFLVDNSKSLLGTMYRQVHTTMIKLHAGKGSIEDLVKIASGSFKSMRMTKKKQGIDITGAFRMAVWLTTYYDFFDKNIKSERLCSAICGEQIAHLFEEGHIAIIQRFLNPALMLVMPQQQSGQAVDPLLELFRPSESKPLDQSDSDLRHALANMVAVVIGSPKASNHLWYHIFAPGDLADTYMTGFMYDTKVNSSGLHYDCGVELSPDGLYGCQDYLKHACRGTYTIHSLYLLLWANFGAFCVALLTQPTAEKNLHETVISNKLSIRHYCLSQLRKIWLFMKSNFNISDEERSFFIMKCMMRLFELGKIPATAAILQLGRFLSREQLDKYEKMWHTDIYQPSWSEIKEAYSLQWYNPFFQNMRTLDEQYPQLPTEKDFIHNLLRSGGISLHVKGGGLFVLTQFVLERHKLQAGECLLPDLVEFYLWLHTQLAYVVSYDIANKLKIGQVIERAVERYSNEFGKHVKDLYERVKIGYNTYVNTIGHGISAGTCVAVHHKVKVCTINDDMPLLPFLSDTTEEGEGNDWLYTVMADIVNTHNNFIEGLYMMTRSQSLPLDHLLPSEPSKISLTEFTPSHCIVGGKNCHHDMDDFLQLLHSRYLPQEIVGVPDCTSKADKNSSTCVSDSEILQIVCQFNFPLLLEDIVATYFTGKPLLESPSSIRKLFKFRNTVAQHSSLHMANAASCGDDIDMLGDQLPDFFKVPCDDSTVRKMEFEFHSASYQTLLEAVQAIRIALGHLINFMKKGKELQNSADSTLTVRQFMATLDNLIDQNTPVFAKACIPTLCPPQVLFLEALSIAMLFSSFKLLIQWLKDGVYDFHTLPFTLKAHLTKNDHEALLKIPAEWKGDMNNLLNELKELTDSLVHSEADFTKNSNDTVQIPIIQYLEDFHFLCKDDLLPTLIPRTICVQHYVAFRVALRGLVAKVQLSVTGDETPVKVIKWQEFVGDVWDKRLLHFRDYSGNGMMLYDHTTGKCGFEGSEVEDERPSLHEVLNTDAAAAQRSMDFGDAQMIGNSVDAQLSENPAGVLDNDDEEYEVIKNEAKDNDEWEVVNSGVDTNTASSINIELLAKNYSVDNVADFLKNIRLNQYIDVIRSESIDGELLLAAGDNELNDLGVSNPLHRFKIQYLFKRVLQKTPPTHTLATVNNFLAENKMHKYQQQFAKEEVDGDMLLEITQLESTISDPILEALGIMSSMDRLKFKKKFKPSEEPKQ